jgi:hypothetical protein
MSFAAPGKTALSVTVTFIPLKSSQISPAVTRTPMRLGVFSLCSHAEILFSPLGIHAAFFSIPQFLFSVLPRDLR